MYRVNKRDTQLKKKAKHGRRETDIESKRQVQGQTDRIRIRLADTELDGHRIIETDNRVGETDTGSGKLIQSHTDGYIIRQMNTESDRWIQSHTDGYRVGQVDTESD